MFLIQMKVFLGAQKVLICGWVHKFTLESVRRRTEVLSCGWVHKFTLESGGRSEDSINLLTLGWTIRWGRECKVQILYYCRNVHQANPDAPVDETTAQSKDDEVNKARTNLTRRDPVHCESKWERFSHRQLSPRMMRGSRRAQI